MLWLLTLSTIKWVTSLEFSISRLDYIQTYHHVSQGVWKAFFQCHYIHNHIKSILWIYVRSRVLEFLDRLIYRGQFALSMWICVDSRRQMQRMLPKEKLWLYQTSDWFRVSNFVQFLKQISLVFFTSSNCTEVSCYVARQLSCIIECIWCIFLENSIIFFIFKNIDRRMISYFAPRSIPVNSCKLLFVLIILPLKQLVTGFLLYVYMKNKVSVSSVSSN